MTGSAPPGTRRAAAVIGASGCVGGHVCEAFARAGHDVLAIARRGPSPHAAGRAFVPLDVAATEPARLAGILADAGVDVVVNAAGGWLGTVEENEYHHVRLTERLVAGAALMARRPRIIQIGSIHEYGPVPYGVSIDESAEPRPRTPYARTKLASSQALLDATAAGDAHGVVLRAVNVCGPRVTPASFLGTVVRRLRDAAPGTDIDLAVDDAERDFLDVRDLAAAVFAAADAPAAVGRAVNVGRGEAVAIRRLLELLLTVAGFGTGLIRERDDRVESRGGGWVRADIGLAGTLLGWRPRIGLRESFEDMWKVAIAG